MRLEGCGFPKNGAGWDDVDTEDAGAAVIGLPTSENAGPFFAEAVVPSPKPAIPPPRLTDPKMLPPDFPLEG